MNTLSFKTQSANEATVEHRWHVVDATNLTLGRMCARIAAVLRGKDKPYFTPHVDCGDYVIVINASKVVLTGNKLNDKNYITFSGYPGGQKKESARNLLGRRPEAVIERAVKGMLPKNRLGRQLYKKLYVYAGSEHPHAAQKPQPLTF
jgi:large subunit ribosomal protein L13